MKFTLALPPMGVNHSYHTRGGQWYKDARLKRWEEFCLWDLKNQGKPKHTESVTLTLFYGDKRRRDIDSNIKSILDLLTKAGFYEDDSKVTDLTVHKRFDKEQPRLEIQI